jgi:hypothetical protein
MSPPVAVTSFWKLWSFECSFFVHAFLLKYLINNDLLTSYKLTAFDENEAFEKINSFTFVETLQLTVTSR